MLGYSSLLLAALAFTPFLVIPVSSPERCGERLPLLRQKQV